MFFPNVEDNGNTRQSVSSWLGYNHNYSIADGEYYDGENMTCDEYPIMSVRKVRPVLKVLDESIRGMAQFGNTLAYLHGNKLHYSDDVSDVNLTSYLTGSAEEQTVLPFGAYILLFPAGVWYNTATNEAGTMSASMSISGGATFKYSDVEGNDVTTGHTYTEAASSPSNPEEGDYWLDTTNGILKCFDYDTGMWLEVTTTYVRISFTSESDPRDKFAVGDAVYMNTPVTAINSGSIIQNIGRNHIVVIGTLSHNNQSMSTDLTIDRKLPKLDFVCTSNNRVWGCHYGVIDGEYVNEILCSKQGDPKNWYSYAGLSTDSYAVSVGEPEPFTGAIEYGGYPTFFKENCIYRIYGSYPAQYQVIKTNARGVQNGSDKSLAIVNEYLMYKSVHDICVYDGSTPTSVSDPLGQEMYYNAVAGGCMGKYYVRMDKPKYRSYINCYKEGGSIYRDEDHDDSMTPKEGRCYKDLTSGKLYIYSGGSFSETSSEFYEPFFFVYDMKHGIWNRESSLPAERFSGSASGSLYAYTNKKIYGLGNHNSSLYLTYESGTEPYVKWWFETGDQGYEYADYKYVDRFTIRAYVPIKSEVRISIMYDDEGVWNDIGVMRGEGKTLTDTWTFNPHRCDHYRLRFEGHGDVRIYTMSRTLDSESEER